MPDLLTPQALATAGPLVLETFFKHFFGPKSREDKGKAREDLLYDEAFVLMKTFIEIATKHPVAALQRFGQVRTPSPPWVALHRVIIPQRSLLQASEHLIKALGGEEMAYRIAGGTKWWQVRAGPGVEAEWIVMKKDWKEVVAQEQREKKAKGFDKEIPAGGVHEEEGEFRPEMDRLRCMLYIHGGAYYWGSINTHRYIIWRLAKKMHGRCFAVNYRKAPQYPFPCAMQDCLAAYMYLTNPPPGAVHRPVDPKSIILAGDSAGGGLVLALLQILRDTDGLELPAGAVLISPWSDLTHSFPSILENTATDIVPPYGFIHKPSSLWPPPPPVLTEQIQSRLRARVKEAVSRLRNDPNGEKQAHRRHSFLAHEADAPIVQDDHDPPKHQAQVQTSKPEEQLRKTEDNSESDLHPMAEKAENKHPEPHNEPTSNPSKANPAALFAQVANNSREESGSRATTLAQCDVPLYLDVKGEQVAIDTQIQMYATNAQLCHPWVSPMLGYLGGLPPLFVMCGANEVLRDEIIYLAHKAADPAKYPVREDVRAMLPSLNGIEEKHAPTNVHFQIYDGICHDLVLFSMTRPARGLFRAIASFARFVTPSAPGSLYIGPSHPGSKKSKSERNSPVSLPSGAGTPALIVPDESLTKEEGNPGGRPVLAGAVAASPAAMSPRASVSSMSPMTPSGTTASTVDGLTSEPTLSSPIAALASPAVSPTDRSDAHDALPVPPAFSRETSFTSTVTVTSSDGYESDSRETVGVESATQNRGPREREHVRTESGDDAGPRFGGEEHVDDSRAKEGEAGWPGIYRTKNPFTNHMIRERISTTAHIRPLEPASELSAMQMPPEEVGMIKEGPAMRYLNGQALWNKKYHRAVKGIKKRREKNLKMAKQDGGKLRDKWVKVVEDARAQHHYGHGDVERANDLEEAKQVKKEEEEQGSRREGYGILDQSWSWTWALNGESPPPSAVVSRRDIPEARQLALIADRIDAPNHTRTPFHGLSIWVGLASFFSNSSQREKAEEVVRQAKEDAHAHAHARSERSGHVGREQKNGADQAGDESQSEEEDGEEGVMSKTDLGMGEEKKGLGGKVKGIFSKMTSH